jgi:hypothetical protein
VESDPGTARAAKSLLHIGATISIGIPQAELTGGDGGNRSSACCLKIHEDVAIGGNDEVPRCANAVSEYRGAETRWQSQAAVVRWAGPRRDCIEAGGGGAI